MPDPPRQDYGLGKGSAVIVGRELIGPEALITAPVAPELHVAVGPKLRPRLLQGVLQRPPCFRWEIAPPDLEVAKDVLVQPDPRGEPIESRSTAYEPRNIEGR